MPLPDATQREDEARFAILILGVVRVAHDAGVEQSGCLKGIFRAEIGAQQQASRFRQAGNATDHLVQFLGPAQQRGAGTVVALLQRAPVRSSWRTSSSSSNAMIRSTVRWSLTLPASSDPAGQKGRITVRVGSGCSSSCCRLISGKGPFMGKRHGLMGVDLRRCSSWPEHSLLSPHLCKTLQRGQSSIPQSPCGEKILWKQGGHGPLPQRAGLLR
jgi:hypothetical protein